MALNKKVALERLRKYSKELKEKSRNLSLQSRINSTIFIQLPHFHTLSFRSSHLSSAILSQRKARYQETRTACMTSWITNAFLLDQLLRISLEMTSFFGNTSSILLYTCQTSVGRRLITEKSTLKSTFLK